MTDMHSHISASQIGMYLRCGEQYRRRYVEGEVIPPGIALVQGKAVHRGAEVNFKQKLASHEDLPAGEIVEAAVAEFDAQLAAGISLTREELSRKDKLLGEAKDSTVRLAETHAKQQAPDYQPAHVELPFRMPTSDGLPDLVGVVDLIDDRRRVVDLKTSKRKKPQSEADTSLQLTIYHVGHHAAFREPPAQLRLDILVDTKEPGRQVLRTERTDADVQRFARMLVQVLEGIRKGVFLPADPGSWICDPRWCGYFESCPYRST